MSHPHTDNRNKAFQIDFLSSSKVRPKWIPCFLRGQYSWKVLSGQWELEAPNRVKHLTENKITRGESIALIGSPRWNHFTFQVTFKILTNSLKPPEGGVILYFLFKNINNYYSFHFCHFKRKIELIKRIRGIWTIIADQVYDLKTHKDYCITISTNSGIHQCQIDGRNQIEINDKDIAKGCVGIGAKYCNVEFSHVSVSILSK